MFRQKRLARFERVILPHLDAAYNLARWLTGNEADAEDVVQEAYLRAYKGFDRFSGGNAGGWILTVVRNTCYTWLKKHRGGAPRTAFDEALHSPTFEQGHPGPATAETPETVAARLSEGALVRAALARLPLEFREALVLREFEDLSYREIADITGVPMGTVMSRLARGRRQLEALLADEIGCEDRR